MQPTKDFCGAENRKAKPRPYRQDFAFIFFLKSFLVFSGKDKFLIPLQRLTTKAGYSALVQVEVRPIRENPM